MQAGIGEPARAVEERGPDESGAVLHVDTGVASTHRAGVGLQVATGVVDRRPQRVDDRRRRLGVAQGPQHRDGFRGRDRHVEAGLGRPGGQERLVGERVAQLEQGSQLVAVDVAVEAELGGQAPDPPARGLAGADVVVLGAVDDLTLVVVGVAQLADGDHGSPPAPLVHRCGK